MANSYLDRTEANFGTATNRKKCTISFWLKRSLITSQQAVMGVETTPAGGSNEARIVLKSDDTFEFYDYQSSYKFRYITSRKLRDTSAYYHIVLAVDTTQATASNRIKIYINGVQETAFGTETQPTLNLDTFLNSGAYVQIGRQSTGNSYLSGYLSHYAFVDGQALAPTVFGSTDSTSGIWKFKSPSGVTWGTNGFHLKFENSGAMGTDSSGNTNTFTVNGDLKQALDTPSNVYATFNPFSTKQSYNTTFSNGNDRFRHSQADNHNSCRSTLGFNKGKWYAEFKLVSSVSQSNCMVGIGNLNIATTNGDTAVNGLGGSGYQSGGILYRSGYSDISSLTTYAQNDIIGCACDFDNKMIYFYKNGTLLNGTGYAFTLNSGIANGDFYGFAVSGYQTSGDDVVFDANFGNGYFATTAISSAGSNGNGSLFEYDVPSGYYALNTKNINTYG